MDVCTHSPEAVVAGLAARLHKRGRLRVWSLVVTIFGDAVAPRGGRVALSVLGQITARLGIEAGALRTAMSRLAADGWVERDRQGRNSYYRLAEQGRHAFDLATRRIYAAGPPAWEGAWTVAIAPPGAAVDEPEVMALGFVRVAAGVWLRPETEGAPGAAEALAGMLLVHGQGAEHPETLRALWPSEETANAYRGFIAAYTPLGEALAGGSELGRLDAMAARTLLIHDWRRIVLRDPGLPTTLLPEDWPGEAARKLTADIYGRLISASEAWLDGAGMLVHAGTRRFTR